MEEQNLEKTRKTYWKFIVIFLMIIVITGGGFFVWERYFSQQAEINRQTQKNYEKYLEWERNYEKAMREDIYGGKTPEETLQMFIEALKKEDIELASRYFMLETNTEDLNYLTRKKWEEALKKAKNGGKLSEILMILSRAKTADSSVEGYFGFEVKDDKNELIADINMRLNRYSGIWKIESL